MQGEGSPPLPLLLRDDQFVTVHGSPVHFKAFNWFGYNTGLTMLGGLWSGGSVMQTDFKWIVYQMKLLGFNAVRLPFLFT